MVLRLATAGARRSRRSWHIDVGPGVRAKELVVDIKRTSVRVAKKAEPDAAPLLHGDLQQPVLASESTWMLSDGVLQLTLAKDIRRAANVSGGPGSEWWHGLLEGEDTLDHSKVSVGDYVSIDQVPAEQRENVLQASRADHERQVERAGGNGFHVIGAVEIGRAIGAGRACGLQRNVEVLDVLAAAEH